MNRYAYVTVLYGNNIYLTGAIVLGYSLMKTNTKFDRVILVTKDVSESYRSMLSEVYTDCIEIDYIEANPKIFLETTRFRDVFTKLECLNLIMYDKIILLDLDMIVTQNIDHLFQLHPPAACLKRSNVEYGQIIPREKICDSSLKLVGSINAGLMLLRPDITELDDIKNDIIKNDRLMNLKYPEQDYLSLRYCGKWTSITFNYNYQFGLTARVKQLKYTLDDIHVIHYSSSFKPWNQLDPNHTETEEEGKFQRQHTKYYKLWTSAYHKIKSELKNININLPY